MILLVKKQLGFGLIEVMVVAGIMAAISLSAATLIIQQSKNLTYMEDRISVMNLNGELKRIIQDDLQACTTSLVGKILPLNSGELNFQIRDRAGVVLFDPANDAKNSFDNIKINKVYVKDINVISGGTGLGEAEITIEPLKIRVQNASNILKPIVKRIGLRIDTTNRSIQSCQPTSGTPSLANCRMLSAFSPNGSSPATVQCAANEAMTFGRCFNDGSEDFRAYHCQTIANGNGMRAIANDDPWWVEIKCCPF